MKALYLTIFLLSLLPSTAESGEHFLGQWSDPILIPQFPVVPQQGYPLAVDDQGIRHVVYTGYGTCGSDLCGVYYQSSVDGLMWSPPVIVPGSEDVAFLVAPDVVAGNRRAYIAWFASKGFEISWTDDRGANFAPALSPDPSAPGGLQIGSERDRFGALHFVWDAGFNLYYLRSLPRSAGLVLGPNDPDPVFLPAQRLYAEDGLLGIDTFVGVDDQGFVSISFLENSAPAHMRYTRAYQGVGFPPSIDLGEAGSLQLIVSPEGPVTLAFSRYDASYQYQVFTLLTEDGGDHWQGPFQQTKTKLAAFDRMRSTRALPGGRMYAVWAEWKSWTKLGMTYAESHDYGRTFPIRDFLPPKADAPALEIAPDGAACMVMQVEYYVEYR